MNRVATADTMRIPDAQNTNPDVWVELYGDYLFNFAVGQVGNLTEAEDLVQETFLAALKARERFIGQSSARTWLIGILRHKICDYFRAKSRTQEPSVNSREPNETDEIDESLAWLHEAAADCVGPDRNVELKEFRAALEAALGTLPPRIAQVFELYEIKGCSGREVCEALSISESNLWVMLHRARTQLRHHLAPAWESCCESPSNR